jgi:hypothetical protein
MHRGLEYSVLYSNFSENLDFILQKFHFGM